MKDVSIFSKVSKEEYANTLKKFYPNYDFTDDEIGYIYDFIELPKRSTKKAAGYDFFAPFPFTLAPGCQIAIPTGIRVQMLKDDWGLFLMPKSRNVKNSIRLSNTIGLVDGDYYDSSNEGHIIVFLEMPGEMHQGGRLNTSLTLWGKRLLKEPKKPVVYNAGDGFVQGVFLEVGITEGDDLVEKSERDGGFGSTGNGRTVDDEF